MKLKKLKIKNFRCYREEISIAFDDLTALIARNDIGKSTILEALDAFFNLDKLESGDRSTGLPNSASVEITCVFKDVPRQLIIDTDNLISPTHEYLLNQDGNLEICKVYKGATLKCEEVTLSALHPTAENYDDLLNLSIAQLRRRGNDLGLDLSSVNQTIKSAIRHAIWTHVPDSELNKQLVDLDIKSNVWKQLQNILPLYQLFKADRPSSDQDAEAQDPIKFAIKEALKDKATELALLEGYVREQVESVTRKTIEKLREMDPDLANQLDPKFSSFNWSKVFSVSLTNEDQIPLNKRGSGVRRLFLINFFRAKAEQLASVRDVQDVIFAIEEPENSQHPNNQLLLLDALTELSLDPQHQVLFTTHNPVLAGRIDHDRIRFINKSADGTRYIAENDDTTFEQIKDSLGMFANHNVRVFVGVEGPNDIEYLKRISAMLAPSEADIADFSGAESAGKLVFIPMGGSTLELWTSRLEGLELPEVHILDRDIEPPARAKYQDAADRVNARGQRSFITSAREMENYIHYEAINDTFALSLDSNYSSFDDVPTLVAIAVHEASESTKLWDELNDKKRGQKESKAKKKLNREALSCMTPARLTQVDPEGEVRLWLREISQYVL
ncbi:ATP-binding protein [Vibrio atlanticus]|uniref:ATP-binding protein n=1 Tax=Vibrio atlanticus TaxID=693153 RepID=A0ABV4KUH5_9VIBR